MNALALDQAGRESAMFHLYGALLGLCHEIAGFYRLPQANAPAGGDAADARKCWKSIAIPELAELVELAGTANLAGQLLASFGVVHAAAGTAQTQGRRHTAADQAVDLAEEEPDQ